MQGSGKRTGFSWNLRSSVKLNGVFTPARRSSGTESKSRMATSCRMTVAAYQREVPTSLAYVTTNLRRIGRISAGGTESASCDERGVRSSRRRSFPSSANPRRCWQVRLRLPCIDNTLSLCGEERMNLGYPAAGLRTVLLARGLGNQAWSGHSSHSATPRSTESIPTRGAPRHSGRSRTSWRSVRSSRRARPPIAPPSRSPRSAPGTAARSS